MKEAYRLAQITPKIMNAFHDIGKKHSSDEKLSMRQYQALILLNASKTLTLTQLCEKLGLAPSTGTELVNRMIQLEYIQKTPESKDQRQVNLSVTLRGAEFISQRQELLTEMFDIYLASFSSEDREKFVSSFETILSLIEKYYSK
jgi:MarR family transcriptional regulator, organic hydroperoxide resistance regulator